ncbi:hypothetical protein JTE90_029557 [Oedothorax gibbosus]|uniref:Uncharacterized protein n=1 Tax=Oedothorax gibbosus TaxID=931172 RepID=A0AAV6VCT7_9ARAC|nr:hypothetical protein JTE90_029557 [Oedothorax gibbosus]
MALSTASSEHHFLILGFNKQKKSFYPLFSGKTYRVTAIDRSYSMPSSTLEEKIQWGNKLYRRPKETSETPVWNSETNSRRTDRGGCGEAGEEEKVRYACAEQVRKSIIGQHAANSGEEKL